MVPLVWRAVRRWRRLANVLCTGRSLATLERSDDAFARALVLALQRCPDRREVSDETDWMERIEGLRSRLSASTELIEDIDYGSGRPADSPSDAEMSSGRQDRITLGEQTRVSSLPREWCRLLFQLVRSRRPVTCLELGTSVGISACYQASALELNGEGRLVTLEGAPEMARRARENVRELGLENVEFVIGRFQDTLTDVLTRLEPIDWAFVDGHHDEHATVDYCERIIPRMSAHGVLVLDDITWSAGMLRAWRKISCREEVALAVDLHQIGVIGLGEVEGELLRGRAAL